jgi:excisionase family DNA binding protein
MEPRPAALKERVRWPIRIRPKNQGRIRQITSRAHRQRRRPREWTGAEGRGEPAPIRFRHSAGPARTHNGGTSEQKVLLGSRDVSRLLGLGRTKVFEMMARSELPVVRIGRCVRVPRDALMEWVSSETRLPGRTPGGIR